MQKIICGIQQIGIGVENYQEAWKWYRQNFGMDICIFDDAAVAGLMLPYTGGRPWERHAVLAMNMQSGGGFEVWQYTERRPVPADFEVLLGDTGIYITKIKSYNVKETYNLFKSRNLNLLTEAKENPAGTEHFFVKDPYNNIFEVISDDYCFKNENKLTGGVFGCVIGVTDIDKAKKLYADILGYDEVVYDVETKFEDFAGIPGGNETFRRTLLKHKTLRQGAFSKLLGPTQIELVKVNTREPKNIFENRFWGDQGFIHLCFDIRGMKELKEECETNGFPFVADSASSFDMGEAAGHFSYIEDPDGTLIEFVETHKLPIFKKIGWYFNLNNRSQTKPLPNWMVKTLAFNRVKD
ncbi:MAG: VOC family protein [Bacteroidetes bacterium]|nr:VOC family protein [Bacteroidota bacterium]